jgi:hypothetical protein
MLLSQAFFDLQLTFAQRFAALSGKPLAEVLLKSSNLYIRFGLGRNFDPEAPDWQAYLQGLSQAQDLRDFTYDFYLKRAMTPSGPAVLAHFGCFSYALNGDTLRLHFQHADPEQSSLAQSALTQRRTELRELFRHQKAHFPGPCQVHGVSWLYQLEAYRRLFPVAYAATARPLAARLHSMSLWGQFLNRRGGIQNKLAESFLARLQQTDKLEQVEACFPFQVLQVEAPLQIFYDEYDL